MITIKTIASDIVNTDTRLSIVSIVMLLIIKKIGKKAVMLLDRYNCYDLRSLYAVMLVVLLPCSLIVLNFKDRGGVFSKPHTLFRFV